MARRVLPTLQRRQHALASSEQQLDVLGRVPLARSFEAALEQCCGERLQAEAPRVLQLNLGKRCNQACRHCHVDAGPERREVMSDEVLEAAFKLFAQGSFRALDLTGGAPELHPRFREIVERGHAAGAHVIDRCNLTITEAPNQRDLPEFLAERKVEVVASLPWWRDAETDAQRGAGVFAASIAALRRFNELGYGREEDLILTLVTNPAGAYLPSRQAALELDYRRELARRHGVVFSRLFTITNMPISRYLEWLLQSGNLEYYLNKLVNAFNPAAVAGLMCRTTLSVGWDGRLYDCDFNQMLELSLAPTVFEVQLDDLAGRAVRTAAHCFGCTAGAGSSCGGATVKA